MVTLIFKFIVCLIIFSCYRFNSTAVDAGPIVIVLPHDGEAIVTDYLLFAVQLPLPSHQLETDGWYLCVNTNLSTTFQTMCWSRYDESFLDEAGFHTFAHLYETQDIIHGTYFLEAVLTKLDKNGAALPGAVSSMITFELKSVRNAISDSQIDDVVNTVADSTFVGLGSTDMLLIRQNEHHADIMALIDSNQSFTGAVSKGYRFEESILLPLNASSPAGTVYELLQTADCQVLNNSSQSSRSSIYCTDVHHQPQETPLRTFVIRPPQDSNWQAREPLHRDSVSYLMRELRNNTPDFCIISDTDEILRRGVVDMLKVNMQPIIFLRHYYYDFPCLLLAEKRQSVGITQRKA